MSAIRVKLIQDYKGTPKGEYIQVTEGLYQTLKENGFVADPDPELEDLKKKSKKKASASDAEPSN